MISCITILKLLLWSFLLILILIDYKKLKKKIQEYIRKFKK